jgi:anaerobic dimethyl sulfoxide reductase subunit C (anchor subunit)
VTGLAWKEWPLVGFTLLSQTAAGAFWMVAGASFYAETASGWNSRYLTFPFLAAVGVVLVLAAAVSLFHLGQPWRAVFVLNNLKRSWLSREILFELVFMALAASLALLVLKKVYRPTLVRILVVLAFAASLLFILSMAKLYMMRTVPAWRGLYTPLSFFGTALLLGPLAAAFSCDTLLDLGRKARPFIDTAAIVALAAVVLILLTIFLFTPGLGLFGPKKATLLELPPTKMYPHLLVRLLFLSGTVLCSFLYYRKPSAPLLTLAFLSGLAAEAAGRLLFYAVYSRLGV